MIFIVLLLNPVESVIQTSFVAELEQPKPYEGPSEYKTGIRTAVSETDHC